MFFYDAVYNVDKLIIRSQTAGKVIDAQASLIFNLIFFIPIIIKFICDRCDEQDRELALFEKGEAEKKEN